MTSGANSSRIFLAREKETEKREEGERKNSCTRQGRELKRTSVSDEDMDIVVGDCNEESRDAKGTSVELGESKDLDKIRERKEAPPYLGSVRLRRIQC